MNSLLAFLAAVITLGGFGLLFGLGLAFASKKFAVPVDPRLEEIVTALPGANCGGCGYPGCVAYAEGILEGAELTLCPVGGAAVAARLAEIMGAGDVEVKEKLVATVYCQGDKEACGSRHQYAGVQTCSAAQAVGGGDKACSFGCLGYGDCAAVCPFDAITMSEDRLPIIDEEKCQSCEKCVAACPRNIIGMRPESNRVQVRCLSTDKGAVVRKICQIGCIGCGICARVCPFDAITVENNLATIDPAKCRNCGLCVPKCPTHAIYGDLEGRPKAVIGDGCVGCTLCKRVCPVGAIEGELKSPHKVIADKCVGCGACVEKCPQKVITLH